MDQTQFAAMVTRIQEIHARVALEYQELQDRFDDEEYDEDYDDTLTRKYAEGGSDYLAIVLEELAKLSPIEDRYEEGYEQGATDTLQELSSVYEGVGDTDLGKEYLGGQQ